MKGGGSRYERKNLFGSCVFLFRRTLKLRIIAVDFSFLAKFNQFHFLKEKQIKLSSYQKANGAKHVNKYYFRDGNIIKSNEGSEVSYIGLADFFVVFFFTKKS